jgi:hypothetical protein
MIAAPAIHDPPELQGLSKFSRTAPRMASGSATPFPRSPPDGGDFPAGMCVDVLKIDPTNRNVLYAGTHLGVYRSPDRGATGALFGTGMPLVEVSDIYLSDDSSLMRASTYGRRFCNPRSNRRTIGRLRAMHAAVSPRRSLHLTGCFLTSRAARSLLVWRQTPRHPDAHTSSTFGARAERLPGR